MNAVQRFFRRYIFSMVGIVIIFLAVNIALFFVILITGSMSGAVTSFTVRDFSDHVALRDGNMLQTILPFLCCKSNPHGR